MKGRARVRVGMGKSQRNRVSCGVEGRNEHVHVCVRREGKVWAVLCTWT